jgi:hypothetical protein
MNRTTLLLAALLLGGLTFLAVANTAEAAPPVRLGYNPAARAVVYPGINRAPGWNWWQTYPYSRYNYGRNIYNPVVVPYPVYTPYVYPVYPPQPYYSPIYNGTPIYPLDLSIGR